MNNLFLCFLSAALAAITVSCVFVHLFRREREKMALGQSFPLWKFVATTASLKGAFIRKIRFFGDEEAGEIREVEVYPDTRGNGGHIEFVCDWLGKRRNPLSTFSECTYTRKVISLGLEDICLTPFPYNGGTMFCLVSPRMHELVLIDPGRWKPCVTLKDFVTENEEAVLQPA